MESPSKSQVADIAAYFGIDLNEQQVEDLARIVAATIDDVSTVEALPTPPRPSGESPDPAGRTSYRPSDEEDPLNAWLRKCRISHSGEGKLSGKTVGLKDTINLAGVELTIGTSEFEGYVPAEDATIVTRLLDAGATIVGKNNMIGFGSDYRPPKNPTAPEYSIGGSTSGGAAAVAGGEADIAIGGDQEGSIRIPASYAGLVGLKPTHGLLPYSGVFGHAASLDYVGPITRTVKDAALATEVMAGRDGLDTRQPARLPVDPYSDLLDGDVSELDVGVLREGFQRQEAHEDVTDVVYAAVDDLESLGANATEVSIPRFRDALPIVFLINLVGVGKTMRQNGATAEFDGWHDTERIAFMERRLRDQCSGLSPSILARWFVTEYLDRDHRSSLYAKARNWALLLRREIDQALDDVDCLVLPTSPSKPRRAGENRGIDRLKEQGAKVPSAVNTGIFNLTHHPALTIPCGDVDGAPVGMMIVGDHFDETTLFQLAESYERHRDRDPS